MERWRKHKGSHAVQTANAVWVYLDELVNGWIDYGSKVYILLSFEQE